MLYQLHDFGQNCKSLCASVNSQVMGIINTTYFMHTGGGLAGRMPGTVTKFQAIRNNIISFFTNHSHKQENSGRGM